MLPLINTSDTASNTANLIQHGAASGAGANGLNRIAEGLPPDKLEGEVIAWAERAVRQAVNLQQEFSGAEISIF